MLWQLLCLLGLPLVLSSREPRRNPAIPLSELRRRRGVVSDGNNAPGHAATVKVSNDVEGEEMVDLPPLGQSVNLDWAPVSSLSSLATVQANALEDATEDEVVAEIDRRLASGPRFHQMLILTRSVQPESIPMRLTFVTLVMGLAITGLAMVWLVARIFGSVVGPSAGFLQAKRDCRWVSIASVGVLLGHAIIALLVTSVAFLGRVETSSPYGRWLARTDRSLWTDAHIVEAVFGLGNALILSAFVAFPALIAVVLTE